jgi:hypothetical protein
VTPPDEDEREEIAEGLREVRERARSEAESRSPLPEPARTAPAPKPLPRLVHRDPAAVESSPDRGALNEAWDVAIDGYEGGLFRSALRRLRRLFLGPLTERQVRMNSLQVKFDNEVVRYIDDRMDRMSRHYDEVLGLHGKRMEEIDERHRILQEELVRHVHDLVERIDFVFESTEQNHLYLEGMLRELREELKKLAEKLTPPPPETR